MKFLPNLGNAIVFIFIIQNQYHEQQTQPTFNLI